MKTSFNINDEVWVELTRAGIDRWDKHWAGLAREGSNVVGVPSVIWNANNEGKYTRFQFWELMNIFGESMWHGNPNLPFKGNTIYFKKPRR